MSKIIETVRRAPPGGKPTLRLECENCGAVNLTMCDKAQARRMARCVSCKRLSPACLSTTAARDFLAVYGDDRGFRPWDGEA